MPVQLTPSNHSLGHGFLAISPQTIQVSEILRLSCFSPADKVSAIMMNSPPPCMTSLSH